LALCQRYYSIIYMNAQSPAASTMSVPWYGPVNMRAFPTITQLSAGSASNATLNNAYVSSNQPAGYFQIVASVASGYVVNASYSASAEL